MPQSQAQQFVDHRPVEWLRIMRKCFEGLRQLELGGARAQQCLQCRAAHRDGSTGESFHQLTHNQDHLDWAESDIDESRCAQDRFGIRTQLHDCVGILDTNQPDSAVELSEYSRLTPLDCAICRDDTNVASSPIIRFARQEHGTECAVDLVGRKSAPEQPAHEIRALLTRATSQVVKQPQKLDVPVIRVCCHPPQRTTPPHIAALMPHGRSGGSATISVRTAACNRFARHASANVDERCR
jgi:hypothetical protein